LLQRGSDSCVRVIPRGDAPWSLIEKTQLGRRPRRQVIGPDDAVRSRRRIPSEGSRPVRTYVPAASHGATGIPWPTALFSPVMRGRHEGCNWKSLRPVNFVAHVPGLRSLGRAAVVQSKLSVADTTPLNSSPRRGLAHFAEENHKWNRLKFKHGRRLLPR